MERAHHHAFGRWPEEIQRDQADGRRHLAAHADAHVAGAGARWAPDQDDLSHYSAARGLRADQDGPLLASRRRAPRPLGTDPCARYSQGAREIRQKEAVTERRLHLQVSRNRRWISQRQLDPFLLRFVRHSPAIYYLDIRLDRGGGLVTRNEMLPAEVTVASGFSSQVHFSRA